MKLRFYRIPIISMLLLLILTVSCKDEWDAHYSTKASSKSDLNIYDYIQSRSELSTFTQMLQITGYDSILSRSQTFTVWAPDNTALLGVDMSNTNLLKKLVENHITRYSYSTAGIKSRSLLMMNNKIMAFTKGANGFTFGGKSITEPDIAVKNGIIHILNEYVPYKKNIWEFITEADNVDSIRNFINSITTYEFDANASYKNDILVDSIFKTVNYVFDNLAAIGVEDSIYTAIIPNNAAWIDAYSRILPYYKVLPADGGEEMQSKLTKTTIVNDMFFRGKIELPVNKDTLYSTYGNMFVHPDRLFANAQVTEMSNGISYVTDQLKNTANESWYKPIKIEAEFATYGRITSNYAATAIPSIGTGYNISYGYYLNLVPTTSSSISKLFVNFPIPSTLSAKYDIYCVYVPTTIVDQNDLRPYKMKYYISYVDSLQHQITNKGVNATNELAATTSQINTFTTIPGQIDTMLVLKNFKFPYSNLVYDKIDPKKSITVSLKVENAAGVTAAELTNFNRNIRIDCLILKPVQE